MQEEKYAIADLTGIHRIYLGIRAQYLHEGAIVLGLIFGALSHSFSKNKVETGRWVPVIPEYARVRIVADGG